MEKERVDENRTTKMEMERLRSLHDEAFHCISQGMACEERKQDSPALQMYLAGREKLLEALQIKIPQGPQFDSQRTMQAKMQKHLEELKGRISSLQREGPRNEAPPAYAEMNGNAPPRGTQLNRPGSMMSEEVFSIAEGVFLFQVSSAGRVTSPQPSTSLQVMCFMPDSVSTPTTENAEAVPNTPPPAFLQVGEWVCPLVPGQTIVLKTGYGAYMFPDLANGNEQNLEFVGIILPADLSLDRREIFEHLLVELTLYQEEEEPQEQEGEAADRQLVPSHRILRRSVEPDARFSHKLSDALVTGAGYVGTALHKGTQWTGYWVQRGAQKLRERMVPEDRPMKIDPRLQTGLQVARDASGVARKCSGFLVGKLSEMTFALAQQAAPHVRYYGNKLLVKSGVVDEDSVDSANNNVMDDICVVAAGGVQSFSVLYMSLETAARQLASCLASETVQVVHHKYGAECSEVVDNAVSSLGNLALATNNIRSFGVKAIAKRTAKETGKAVLKDYVDKRDDDRPQT